MSFIEEFFNKPPNEITAEDIKKFIDAKHEESLSLDYKRIDALKDKNSLSKIVSAMANSEGGLLFLGVSEKEDKDEKGRTIRIYPEEITWGDKSNSKETLEQVLFVA